MIATHSLHDTTTTLDIPQTPHGHFQLHLYALITCIVHNIQRTIPSEALAGLLDDYPFLSLYEQELGGHRFNDLLADFESTYVGHLPIRALQADLSLTNQELRLLLVAGLVEEDIRFGALFAALQHPQSTRYPCLGMLDWLILQGEPDAVSAWTAAEHLATLGLIEIVRRDESVRLEWTVRVPIVLWDALHGSNIAQPTEQIQRHATHECCHLDDLILPESVLKQVAQVPRMIQQHTLDALVLRGMAGTGRRTTIGAIAHALQRDLLLFSGADPSTPDRRLLGPLATLTGAIPVIRMNANPGDTVTLNYLPGYRGTIGVTMSRMGGIDGTAMENGLTLLLPPPDHSQRTRFWQAAGVAMSPAHAELIVDRFMLTGGRIHRVGTLAKNQMQLAGRTQVEPTDVQTAMRALNRQALETLATPLTPVDGWSQLVAHPRLEAELKMLEARCRGREALQTHVGKAFTNNLNRGVRALFSGSSGTGKTLTARALAGELHMDIYRVDLAGIVNKYIGETEKNLNQVFTYAEELDVILLLDEGDSLMTQRTEVKGSNDRYANLETNFLLQRLETYEGIILVTTNAAQRIDQAFVRRLDVVIDFALPEADQRRALWELHLPASHQVSQVFLMRVAERCSLSGGQIRNAALHASLLAMKNREQMREVDLDEALQREYRKASMPYPLRTSNH